MCDLGLNRLKRSIFQAIEGITQFVGERLDCGPRCHRVLRKIINELTPWEMVNTRFMFESFSEAFCSIRSVSSRKQVGIPGLPDTHW